MRAAAYIRLSELVDGTTSPERQRDDVAKVIEHHGWTHDPTVDLYEDVDLSAYSGVDRPAYGKLMASLDRYDVIVVWKLDRFLRRFTMWGRVVEQLEAHDVQLVSVNDTLDTSTPIGQAIAGFLAAQAETESANTSMRIRSHQQHARLHGKWIGGLAPDGWQPVPHPDGGWRLVLDPQRAPVILELVDRLERGESGRAVAVAFNEAGIPSATGKPWSAQQVYKVARNPRLAGWQSTDRGRTILRDGDGDPVAGPEPLIGHERWQRLVDRLKFARWDKSSRRGATMMSGLIRCGICTYAMAGWTGDDRGTKASYVCRQKIESGRAVCRGTSILTKWVDAYVGEQVVAAVERYRTMIPDPEPHQAPADPVAELVAQLRRLERDRTELGLYDDPESEQVYVAKWRDLRGRIVQARRAAADGSRRAARPAVDDVAPEDIAGAWPGMSNDEKRAVVRAMVDRVLVHPVRPGMWGKWDPERVEIVWLSEVV